MRKIFGEPTLLTDEERKKCQRRIIVEECASCGAGNVVLCQYFTALMMWLGFSEAEITFITTIPSIALVSMLLVPYLSAKLRCRKKVILFLLALEHLPVGLLFFLPLLGAGSGTFALAVVAYSVYSLGMYMANPLYLQWVIAIAPSDDAGRSIYFGKKSTFTNLIVVGALLFITLIGKQYENENPVLLYTIVGAVGLAFYLLKIICLLSVPEVPVEKSAPPAPFFRGMKEIFACKKYRPYLIMSLFDSFALGMMNNISPVFYQGRMGLAPSFLALLTVVSAIVSTVFSYIWGKISAKTGLEKTLVFILFLRVATFLLNVFFTPENASVMLVIFRVLAAIVATGAGVISTPYLFECTPPDNRTVFFSFPNVFNSLCISLPLSFIMTAVVGAFGPDKTFTLFGMQFTEMHVIFLVGSLLYLVVPFCILRSMKRKAEEENLPD